VKDIWKNCRLFLPDMMQSLLGSRWWRFGDPSLHCFYWYTRVTDRQTEFWDR